jgi:hypothetical protein
MESEALAEALGKFMGGLLILVVLVWVGRWARKRPRRVDPYEDERPRD